MRTRSPLVVTDEFNGSAHLPRIWGSKDAATDGSFIRDNQIIKVTNGIVERVDLAYQSEYHPQQNQREQAHVLIRLHKSRRLWMDPGKRHVRL